ncbi:AsmA family protein [Roseomonas sp. TAS13]|nr:AsmA family protein [Roseomonas sp. TAS13]
MELAAPPRKASGGDDASPWLARHPIPWRPARFPAHADRWALDDWCPPETVEAVAALHRQGRYDVVIASYTWMSAVLEAVPGAFRVLDTHDLIGGRAAEAARLGLAPSWFWTGLAEEAAGLARAELVLGIQPEESEVLRRRGARAVLTVGHATGPGAVPPRARGPATWDFGLLASANVWNLHGVAALDRALAPHPGIPWLLAGEAGVAGGFRSAGMAIGPVAEAGAFYRLVDCVVNPVEGGTGLKIKTVEALGLGHPVIGTRHAFAGLGARHPAQQAGDAAAAAGWMAEYRASPALRTELLAASRELAGRWRASVEEGLDRLAALEADLRLRVGLLRAGRLDWRNGEAVLALHGGRLLADPLAIDGAGGRIALRVAAEGTASPPSLDVSAHAPSVDLAALLPALGLPGGVSGMLDAETALSARGRTLREMAAGLNGSLGLALADGRVDISLLDAVAGDLRRLLLPNAPRNGSEAVRCLALRLQARDGVASAQAMLLETDIASVLGSGSVDLGQERLDLRLLPRARLGGIGLAIPVVVDGALAQPRLRADPQGAASAGAAILKELSNRRNDPGGTLGQTLNQALGQILGEGDSEADCAAQLRIARGGREGPVPAPAAPENRQGGVGDLLRGLLRR